VLQQWIEHPLACQLLLVLQIHVHSLGVSSDPKGGDLDSCTS
jgi:hypothetical protein